MFKNKKAIIALAVAFIIFWSAYFSVAILNKPDISFVGTPGNIISNLANGGQVLPDGEFLLYIENSQLIKASTDTFETLEILATDALGELQMSKDKYYYLNDEKNFIEINKDGSDPKIILEGKNGHLLIGNMLFYPQRNGQLYKRNIKNNKEYAVDIITSNFYTVFFNNIYYIDNKNDLCKTAIDGRDKTVINENVDMFTIGNDKKIYYANGGRIFSYDLNREKTEVVLNEEVQSFAVINNSLIWKNGEELKHMNLSGEKIVSVLETEPLNFRLRSVYCDDIYVYYYNDDEKLCRILYVKQEKNTPDTPDN